MFQKVGGSLVDYENIKELIALIDASSLKEMEYSKDGIFLRLSKNENKIVETHAKSESREESAPLAIPQAILAEPAEAAAVKQEGKLITSPIVGVVYLQANPEADAYVSVGDTVKEGQVLCLVEAMKIMNEINSEQEGKIVEIFVENGQVVEYNQPLFRII